MESLIFFVAGAIFTFCGVALGSKLQHIETKKEIDYNENIEQVVEQKKDDYEVDEGFNPHFN